MTVPSVPLAMRSRASTSRRVVVARFSVAGFTFSGERRVPVGGGGSRRGDRSSLSRVGAHRRQGDRVGQFVVESFQRTFADLISEGHPLRRRTPAREREPPASRPSGGWPGAFAPCGARSTTTAPTSDRRGIEHLDPEAAVAQHGQRDVTVVPSRLSARVGGAVGVNSPGVGRRSATRCDPTYRCRCSCRAVAVSVAADGGQRAGGLLRRYLIDRPAARYRPRARELTASGRQPW